MSFSEQSLSRCCLTTKTEFDKAHMVKIEFRLSSRPCHCNDLRQIFKKVSVLRCALENVSYYSCWMCSENGREDSLHSREGIIHHFISIASYGQKCGYSGGGNLLKKSDMNGYLNVWFLICTLLANPYSYSWVDCLTNKQNIWILMVSWVLKKVKVQDPNNSIFFLISELIESYWLPL